MNAAERKAVDARLTERLTTRGFRFTPQREQVYAVLLEQRDHPTAEEVFIRAKRVMPEISMATVYNCLDALVQCGVVRQVTLDRGAARFCPNMQEHGHFYCDVCGRVYDVPVGKTLDVALPRGFRAERVDLAVHGQCGGCDGKARSALPADGKGRRAR
jgi:Fur family peroxide stress response transcriptional regulator